MSSSKLKNAPLKEVIFELHWECGIDSNGAFYDAGFDLAQGKFADKLKASYPIHRKILPDGAPIKIFGAPLHQYWKGEFVWPVIQHGQGMIAVNEVEQGYEWEASYKPALVNTIHQLIDSYEEKLLFNRLKLQYIDAWDLNGQDALEFISQQLQTEIRNYYQTPGNLRSINIQQNFDLENGLIMSLNIFNGINNENQQPSVIWTTTVERHSRMNVDEVVESLESAHAEVSEMFKRMLNPEFYASLDR
jgi:uncharacterized protein (TIGR04255 family)